MAWLTGWRYRKKITVSNGSADYQTKVLVGESSGATGEEVDCGGKCQTDFDDLRFTGSDGTTLLDYWIESITGTTPNQLPTVWVQNDATPSTTCYMYYGNPSATAVSSGDNTFIIFNSGSTVTGWTDVTSTGAGNVDWASSSGKIRATGNDAIPPSACLFCNTQTGINAYKLHADIIAQDGQTVANYQQALVHKTTQAAAYGGYGRWLDLTAYNKWGLADEVPAEDFSSADDAFDARTTHEYIITRVGDDSKLYVDNALKVTHTKASWLPQYIGLYVYIAVTAHWVDFSNIFVAKYAATEPTFAFGSQEMIPRHGFVNFQDPGIV